LAPPPPIFEAFVGCYQSEFSKWITSQKTGMMKKDEKDEKEWR